MTQVDDDITWQVVTQVWLKISETRWDCLAINIVYHVSLGALQSGAILGTVTDVSLDALQHNDMLGTVARDRSQVITCTSRRKYTLALNELSISRECLP